VTEFHKRLERRAKSLGMSMSQISKQVGKPAAYFSNMLANENDPSGSMLVRLAEALETTPNDLLGISNRYQFISEEEDETFVDDQASALVLAVKQRAREKLCEIGRRPGVKEIVGWALRNNGKLEDFDKMLDFSTLYEQPKESDILPIATHVGQKSLASQTLFASCSDHLNSLMRAMPKTLMSQLIFDQSKLETGRPIITVEKINVSLPDEGVDVDFEYLRAYIQLTDTTGKKLVLNYSEPIF
jgi:transcriptional regulator with XRE-family HTH domain